MNFDEYRLLVQPDVGNVGQWTIHVQKAPRSQFLGPKPSTTPTVQKLDIDHLRNPTAPPDLARLRKMGKDVFDSLLPAGAQAELGVCLDDARNAQKGLRIVVSILGNKPVPGAVGCHEIPVEALFAQHLNFLATDVATPVSRGLTVEADRPAVRVAPPLRVLVVISEPSGMPPVQGNVERQAILAALADLINAGAVEVDFCTPPTPARLDAMLQQQPFHVVHFIGHGDFDSDGIDPNPQPYLYFEDDPPQRKRRAVDAEQMYTMLRNGNVPLVVMTACSSAATQPNGTEYPALAFEGMAQTLVQRTAGPLAVVGMQFDFETAAASVFSKTLYRQLLMHDMSIDAAVAAARGALVTTFGAAHRSWVNPTVYWRCKDGRLFDLIPTTGTLTPQQLAELKALDMMTADYETMLSDLTKESAASAQSPSAVAAHASVRTHLHSKIEDLVKRRGILLGDTLRLRGGTIKADGTVDCSLALRIRAGARIGDIQANLAFDAAEFSYDSYTAGADVLKNSLLVQAPANAGDPLTVLVRNASANNEWTAGEHSLMDLKFKVVTNGTGKPLFRISLRDVTVSRDNVKDPSFGALDAVVFAP
jgi:hypothetical protein